MNPFVNCSKCGQTVELNNDGTMRAHDKYESIDPKHPSVKRRVPCN